MLHKIPHDTSIRVNKSIQDPTLFRFYLNEEIQTRVEVANNSTTDAQNLLKNNKKWILYFKNEGESLVTFQKNKEFQERQQEFFKEMFALILNGQANNLIYGNLSPKYLIYSIVQSGLVLDKGRHFVFPSQNNLSSSVDSFENSQNWDNYMIRIYTFEESPIVRKRSNDLFSLETSYYVSQRNVQNAININLKLMNYEHCRVSNFEIFQYEVKKGITRYLEYMKKGSLKMINTGILDLEFNFHDSLGLLLKNGQESEKKCTPLNSTRSINFHFDYEEDLNQYRNSINSSLTMLGDSSISNSFSFKKKESVQNNKILEFKEDIESTLINKISNYFDSLFSDKKVAFSAEDNEELERAIAKIKSVETINENKFQGVLGLLKINSQFVEDAESCFYLLLNFFDLYPPSIPSSDVSLGMSLPNLSKSYLQKSHTSSDIEMFKNEKMLTFLNNDQIDILISILAVIEKTRFPVYEIGIMKIFGHFKSKELEIRRDKFLSRNESNRTDFDIDDGYSDSRRFHRLKFLIYDLAQFKKDKVLQLLGLETKGVKHLLIKLMIEQSANFSKMPDMLRRYFELLKKFIFQFLVYFVCSKEYSYLHKFLVVAVFKAKE